MKSILKTYEGGKTVQVKMLQDVGINNLLYSQSRKYEIPYNIAKELSKEGICFYIIKFKDWSKENE